MNKPGIGPSEIEFEGFLSAYRRWRREPVGIITDAMERRAILELAGNLKESQLLDVGCGDGTLGVILGGLGACVTGIDPDVRMLSTANKHLVEAGLSPRLAAATGEALPFPDATFDHVIAVTVLCTASDPATLVHEAARVLKPGGHLILADLGIWSIWTLLRRVRGLFGHSFWRKARFQTPASLERFTGKA